MNFKLYLLTLVLGLVVEAIDQLGKLPLDVLLIIMIIGALWVTKGLLDLVRFVVEKIYELGRKAIDEFENFRKAIEKLNDSSERNIEISEKQNENQNKQSHLLDKTLERLAKIEDSQTNLKINTAKLLDQADHLSKQSEAITVKLTDQNASLPIVIKDSVAPILEEHRTELIGHLEKTKTDIITAFKESKNESPINPNPT